MTGPPPTSRGDGEWSANQVKRVLIGLEIAPAIGRARGAPPRPLGRDGGAHPPTIRPDRRSRRCSSCSISPRSAEK